MEEEKKETTETNIKWFSEITKNSINLVGEKAAYLGEAYKRKILSKRVSTPEGFVLTKKAISNFFSTNGISNAISNIFEEINWEDEAELTRATDQIKQLILKSNLPKELEEEIKESYEDLAIDKLEIGEGSALSILSNSVEPIFVAVRNSYNNESGDSHFNIKGISNVLYTIKRCIASLFEPGVLKEEKEKGISPDSIRTAIIIQKMVQADKSGTLYSENQLEIDAIWGLGGGLKIPEIRKDRYTVRRDFRIINKDIQEKKYAVTRDSAGALKLITLKEGYSFEQVLDDGEIQELTDAALRLDDIFKENTQFDFAIENDEIYLVKIEKLKGRTKDEEEEPEDIKEELSEIPEEKIKIKTQTINSTIEDSQEEIEKEIKNPILPPRNITQTKIKLLIRNENEKEKGFSTQINKGFIVLEDIIRERGLHPNYYIENFNTKGYGELLSAGLENLSTGLDEVWVRLSDFTTKQFKNLEGAPEREEENPLMGLCGIRYLLSKPELLKRELKAISDLTDSKKEVGVFIPKITSVYELRKVKETIESLNTKLKVGIVFETPASIQLVKDFIEEGIDAVAFSGDSLTKYLLAIDPQNKNVKGFYDDTCPALMYQLEYVIRVCRRNNVKTSFFGQALKKKEMVNYLVKKNIETVVLTPEEVNATSELIHKAEVEFISGTDKEVRQYEINKEKQRQQKELKDFEKMKDIQVEQEVKSMTKQTEKEETNEENITEAIQAIEEEKKEYSEEKEEENQIPNIESQIPKEEPKDSIKIIEKEKQEYLRENPKETEEKSSTELELSEEKLSEIEKAMQEIDNHKQKDVELKETPQEKFDETPENIEDLGPNDTPNKDLTAVEIAMREIEEHNQKKPRETETEIAMSEIEGHNQRKPLSLETQNESEELIGEDLNETELSGISDTIKKPEEILENIPEDIEKIENTDEETSLENIESTINEIKEEEKKDFTDEFLEEKEQTKTSGDTLGIFG
ncbi:MAG: hypothetical protein PF542_04830 [Nanoarchaeota archaeon]|jgi:phosphoenolpyruvate synthase/pyruvate phosphate dikinase|nr:hypothetical protein [Nanoarchaeota archaeon]